MNHEIISQLRAPFPFEQIETKIQVTSGDKSKGMAIFYLDARSVQERLDKVLEPFGWRNEYIMWHEKSQLCGLSIFNAERGEWVTKYDGAENSDIEAVKGGLTDAFKRSAVLWGVGRYLYEIEGVWVDVEQRGKGSYIKDNQQGKLKAEYDKAVAKIFGTTAHQSKAPANASGKPPQTTENAKLSTPQNKTDNQQATAPAFEYKVHSIKPSGKASQLLELVNASGEIITAYVKNGDNAISTGACLLNVSMEQKTSSYGPYNLINAYELAA